MMDKEKRLSTKMVSEMLPFLSGCKLEEKGTSVRFVLNYDFKNLNFVKSLPISMCYIYFVDIVLKGARPITCPFTDMSQKPLRGNKSLLT